MWKRLVILGGTVAVVALLALAFLPSDNYETLSLSFDGLPPLANGGYWEGWAVIDGTPWSTGQFNVDSDGELVSRADGTPTHGDYPAGRDLSATTLVVISRHYDGDESGPGAPHFLAGEMHDEEATLTFSFPAAVGITFDDAQGVYIVNVDGLKIDTRLPRLPSGWTYEAWLNGDGEPQSLGRFGGETTGPTLQDHTINARGVDPRGGTLSVTLEPVPDDSPAPFGVEVLTARVSASAETGVQYQLERSSKPLPTGHATLK